ncbi:hypothetical protein, partial [Enterococcus casseliflavus]|uniref:hypothetical protein n=1 Tax=Enterococcus casseliflavus TaxID=37734 RepID=UPI003D0CDB51
FGSYLLGKKSFQQLSKTWRYFLTNDCLFIPFFSKHSNGFPEILCYAYFVENSVVFLLAILDAKRNG